MAQRYVGAGPLAQGAGFETVPAGFLARVAQSPASVAFVVREGEVWRGVTWHEVHARVHSLGLGLIAAGVAPGERVALLGRTGLDWIVADLAIQCVGAATLAIYPTTTAGDLAHIVGDAGARLGLGEDAAHGGRLLAAGCGRVVCLSGAAGGGQVGRAACEAAGRGVSGLLARAEAVAAGDLATLLYTSGTTGLPKGVPVSHAMWAAQALAFADAVGEEVKPEDLVFLWLPLSHAYGKVLALGGIAFGQPTVVDGDLDRLPRSLRETGPSFVPAVPRVFEKAWHRMQAEAKAAGPRREALFYRALSVNRALVLARREGRPVSRRLAAEAAVLDRLVLRRVRAAFGGRVRAFLSGSAPIELALLETFEALGMPVMEGYGLTETTAMATANTFVSRRLGSVGRAQRGVVLGLEADGEVVLSGPAICAGYWGGEAFPDGRFFTGDLGRLDADGFLYITGRKKELLVTAGGKNVAPSRAEGLLKGRSALVQEAVLFGDRRPYCGVLLQLDPAVCAALAPGFAGAGVAPEVGRAVEALLAEVGALLAPHERPRRWLPIVTPLTVEGGWLTPSLKVKRAAVLAAYAGEIEAMYAAHGAGR